MAQATSHDPVSVLPTADEQPGGSMNQGSDPDTVARRAYERFQTRGGAHGHDQEDWFAAEREMNEIQNE